MRRLLPLLFATALSCRSTDKPADDADGGTADDTSGGTDGGGDAGTDDSGPDDADMDGFDSTQDCDDTDPDVYPGADERCNDIDDDCDLEVDEDAVDATTWYLDEDDDGYGQDLVTLQACTQPDGYAENPGDCDDTSADFHPGAVEDDCTDPNDYNCDDSVGYADADGDGWAACEDCDDRQDDVNPGAAEICNDIDDDCDLEVDEDVEETFYADDDEDGFGDPTISEEACEPPEGFVTDSSDCDDGDAAINPDADELCDGVDNDCDTLTDDADDDVEGTAVWYGDADEDGFGDADRPVSGCEQPDGTVANGDDCDDDAASVNPDAAEVCDEQDNDCDTLIDDDDPDLSGAPTWYVDYDGDSYGSETITEQACLQPDDFVDNADDCDDTDASTWPDAPERCDSVDNDCDELIDEDAIDGDWYAADEDGDGFGAPDSLAWSCDGADNEWDCDDEDPTEPLVADVATGSSTGDGRLDSPFDTIQAAVDTADRCVAVYPGTYLEAVDLSGTSLELVAINDADDTIIDAAGLGEPALRADASTDATVVGFTLSAGEGAYEESSEEYSCGSGCTGTYTYQTWCGGGVYVDGGSLSMEAVIIDGNVLPENFTTTDGDDITYGYSYGGGICANAAAIELLDAEISGNFATDGGGIYAYGGAFVWLERSRLVENQAVDGGGAEAFESELAYSNVASAWNSADGSGGGILASDAAVDVINSTFGGDDAVTGGGLHAEGSSVVTVDSSILYGAATGEGVSVSGASFAIQYSNVYGNAGGAYSGLTDPTGTDGNLAEDPLFMAVSDDGDASNDDWRLSTGSPSIDAGNPDKSRLDADGSRNDQGAFGGPDSAWAE